MTTHNDMTVHKQWASRPDDERFLTVEDLLAAVQARRGESAVILPTEGSPLALRDLRVMPVGDGVQLLRGGDSSLLSNWSFGQLCGKAGAPAGYLRELPSALAAANLQWNIEHSPNAGKEVSLMFRTPPGGKACLSSLNSPTYGRIWDEDVVRAVSSNVDLTKWTVPGASYAGRDPLRATTLYASDRDVFMFLVNENSIDADGESIKRGFYVLNSEVGRCKFKIAAFTYDRVCDNRIIWGQANFESLEIRHTSGGPARFVEQAIPLLSAYADASTDSDAQVIRRAKHIEVAADRDGAIEWMRARGFAAALADKAYDAAEADARGYNPRTIWGLVQGVTDVAHDMAHADARVEVEAKAGALLEALA